MAIIIVSHDVKDFATWKPHYDVDVPRRENAGLQEIAVGTQADNPNKVFMIWEGDGSREGQSSQEKRPSALRRGPEGRWVSNQSDWLPGVIQETIVCFAVLTAITDLRISFRSHPAGFTLGSVWSRLQLDGGFTHPRSVSSSAPKTVSCRRRAADAA